MTACARRRCGWGSETLYLAEVLPKSKITAFSNSQSQKKYIDDRAQEKGFTNLTVITGDIEDYEFEANSFDRIISVEVNGPASFPSRIGKLLSYLG